MTKKDYELIANAVMAGIAGNNIAEDGDVWYIIQNLAKALEQDNVRFDRTKFLTACGIETGVSAEQYMHNTPEQD